MSEEQTSQAAIQVEQVRFLEGERKRLTKELEALAPPPPPEIKPIDEPLGILFRAYGVPAYNAVSELLKSSMVDCFNLARSGENRWAGLSAAIYKRYGSPTFANALDDVEQSIARNDLSAFRTSFETFANQYDQLAGMVWQFLKLDVGLEAVPASDWKALDTIFIDELEKLSSGTADRDWLKRISQTIPSEGRGLLADVLKRPAFLITPDVDRDLTYGQANDQSAFYVRLHIRPTFGGVIPNVRGRLVKIEPLSPPQGIEGAMHSLKPGQLQWDSRSGGKTVVVLPPSRAYLDLLALENKDRYGLIIYATDQFRTDAELPLDICSWAMTIEVYSESETESYRLEIKRGDSAQNTGVIPASPEGTLYGPILDGRTLDTESSQS